MNRTWKQILSVGLMCLMLLTVGCASKKGKGGGGGGGQPQADGGGGEGKGKRNNANDALAALDNRENEELRDQRDELQKELDRLLAQLNDPTQNGFTGNAIDPNQFSQPLQGGIGVPPVAQAQGVGLVPNDLLARGPASTGEVGAGNSGPINVGFLPGTVPDNANPTGVPLQSSASRVQGVAPLRDFATHL